MESSTWECQFHERMVGANGSLDEIPNVTFSLHVHMNLFYLKVSGICIKYSKYHPLSWGQDPEPKYLSANLCLFLQFEAKSVN